MQTPFSMKMNELSQARQASQVTLTPQAPQPTEMNFLSQLQAKPEVAAHDAEFENNKASVQDSMENHKEVVQNFANSLRQQVQQGQISPAQASTQMDSFVNDIVESKHVGFNDVDSRVRAHQMSKDFGGSPDEIYKQLRAGNDPQKIGRAMSFSQALQMKSQGGM